MVPRVTFGSLVAVALTLGLGCQLDTQISPANGGVDAAPTTDARPVDVAVDRPRMDPADAGLDAPDTSPCPGGTCAGPRQPCLRDSNCEAELFCSRGASVAFGGMVGAGACLPRIAPQISTITTVAGTGRIGAADGEALSATFNGPRSVAWGPDGSLWVADFNNVLTRRISPAGTVSTLNVGGSGATVDEAGVVYLASEVEHVIYRIEPSEDPEVWVGAIGESGLVDGTGLDARFDHPTGLAVHPDGGLVVADKYAHAIRYVSPAGEVTTIAGSGLSGFADGPGRDALFRYPEGVAVHPDGRIFVADKYNNRVRVISIGGVVSTACGTGEEGFLDGPVARAVLHWPLGVAIDPWGSVFIAEMGNHRIRVLSGGNVSTVAGSERGFRDGEPIESLLAGVSGLFASPDGRVFAGDRGNHRIRVLDREWE